MNRVFRSLVLVFLCIISFGANAQVKNTKDTIKKDLLTAPDTVKRLHSNPLSLIPPVVLISYGALSFNVNAIRRIDYYVNGEIRKTDPTFKTKAESYFQFAPIIMVYGLNLVGVTGKNTFVDRTALLALSEGLLASTAYITKTATHRLRPNNSDYRSFPSGHTSTAFMGAEFLAQEFSAKSPAYTVLGYSFAVTTGIFRLYNRDHWFSDVVAGAGFGILSTKAAYLIYPYIRNAFTHKGKTGKSTMLMPSYQNGAAGLSFAMEL